MLIDNAALMKVPAYWLCLILG